MAQAVARCLANVLSSNPVPPKKQNQNETKQKKPKCKNDT
jgi:hypothetical protein